MKKIESFEFTFFFSFFFLNLELETCYEQHFGTENWYMHPYNKTKYVDLKKYAFIYIVYMDFKYILHMRELSENLSPKKS